MSALDAVTARPGTQLALLYSRPFDALFIGGIFVMAVASGLFVTWSPDWFVPIMFADLSLLAYHHVIATFTKLAGTADDRRDHVRLIWLGLPAVTLVTVTVGLLFGSFVIVTVYFYWQWFHYVRQSWGISQRYRAIGGGGQTNSRRFDELLVWSVPVWGILNRTVQNPSEFLFMPIWTPSSIPPIVADIAGLVAIGIVLYWTFTRVIAWRKNELNATHTAFVASHLAVFGLGYVYLDNISHGWLLANIWHNAQYLLFVWVFNRKRFSHASVNKRNAIGWLSQPGWTRAFAYFAVFFIISNLFYTVLGNVASDLNAKGYFSSLSFLLLFAMTLNFHHYIADSMIWKRRVESKPAEKIEL